MLQVFPYTGARRNTGILAVRRTGADVNVFSDFVPPRARIFYAADDYSFYNLHRECRDDSAISADAFDARSRSSNITLRSITKFNLLNESLN